MKLTLSFITLLLVSIAARAQNDYPRYVNGTFNLSAAEIAALPGNSPSWFDAQNDQDYGNYVEISKDVYFEGNGSMLVHSKIPAQGFDFFEGLALKYNQVPTSASYMVSLRVKVPSSLNPGLRDYGIALNSTDANGACFGPSDGGRVNEWFQLTAIISSNYITVDLQWPNDVNYPGGAPPRPQYLYYYVDNIETRAATPILLNASQAGNNVYLNPTGGLSYIKYDWEAAGTTRLAYSYKWTRNGVTESTNKDLLAASNGTLHTVLVKHGVPTFSCGAETTQKIIVGKPTSSPNISICQGDASHLYAYGAIDPGVEYAWYKPDGSLDSYGPSSSLANLAPGTYNYKVRFEYTGTVPAVTGPFTSVVLTVVQKPTPNIQVQNATVLRFQPVVFTATSPSASYSYEYKFYEKPTSPDTKSITSNQISYIFKEMGPHSVTVATTGSGCTTNNTFYVTYNDYQPLCSTAIPNGATPGEIDLDKFTGLLSYRLSTGSCQPDIFIGCIGGPVDAPLLTNTVSASANSYSDDWSITGKWRVKSSYAFNKPVNYQINSNNFEAGRFTLSHFSWEYPKSSERTGWLRLNTIDSYSENGEAMEEHDAFNLKSAAKFGYDKTLPYLVAKNAELSTVFFESFEKIYGNSFEEFPFGSSSQTSGGHSGKSALTLSGNFNSPDITVNSQVQQKGLNIRVWLKSDPAAPTALDILTSAGEITAAKQVARAGVWVLLESNVTNIPSTASSLKISISKKSGATAIIDDLRIQPMDSEMTCYVYDTRTLMLLTVFDDQHFGMYYQYNAEGQLTRKLVETEGGVKTIQETQYNMPTVSK
jgi:hypothetical protein